MPERHASPAPGRDAGAPLLAAHDLAYRLVGRDLVADVSLEFGPGTVQVIVGPNGAGKSTLMRLLCGELRPSRGSVTYGGEAVERVPAWRLAGLRAVLPQAARLAFPFSVAEVARIGVDGIGRGLSSRDRAAIAAGALARADVAHLAQRAYHSLSGGEQARVQFARVLGQLAASRTIAPHQVLFLDEPTASLDLRHQAAILDVALSLSRQGVGVLAILHDLNLAATYADAIIVMDRGRIVARGTPADVLRDDLVAATFGVPWPVGQVPPGNQPFLLPRRTVASTQREAVSQS